MVILKNRIVGKSARHLWIANEEKRLDKDAQFITTAVAELCRSGRGHAILLNIDNGISHWQCDEIRIACTTHGKLLQQFTVTTEDHETLGVYSRLHDAKKAANRALNGKQNVAYVYDSAFVPVYKAAKPAE